MRVIRLVVPVFLLTASIPAQVLAPQEIRDPGLRELQQKYFAELKQITVAVAQHDFPYHFYFSRALDLSEKEQHGSDQRSIQFDHYRDQTVLKITGNYFAAYSTELMTSEQRARQTYQDVMLPLLEAAVPVFATANVPDAFAFEISHHVRKKLIGVSSEGVENVVLILPKTSALHFMTATNPQEKQAAISEGQTFLNTVPIELWPGAARQPVQSAIAKTAERPNLPAPPSSNAASVPNVRAAASTGPGKFDPPNSVSPAAEKTVDTSAPAPAVARDSSPDALKKIQNTYQTGLDRMVQELNTQAHFVRYAPPAFIPFHKGLHLQLSMTTALLESAAGSQYRLAALAFDQHIAHLIRPVLEYFKEDRGDFDGIDFSTSVRVGSSENSDGGSIAVEFIFPLHMLRLYKEFDCTGQQLIDSGFVLINGERVSLNLQNAEAGAPSR